jgi:23S rRNA (guanosine2251-2'-O)-methyltransferase
VKKSKKNMKKYKQKAKIKEIVYGAHAIIEMLKGNKRNILTLYTKKSPTKALKRIKPFLPQRFSNIQYVDKSTLDGIAQSPEHMGVVALTSSFKKYTSPFNPKEHPFILLLDKLQDVRNLGAILRSAYCIGIKGVIITQSKSAPLCPAVFKASAGLAEHLDIYLVPSISSAIMGIKKSGYNIYLSVLNGKNATTIKYQKPLCLVVGNEEKGITKEITSYGQKITIPQISRDVSYNASVATGILMFLMSAKLSK